mgnify:CR=1 FL=1
MKDLIVLVADKNMEHTVRGLLQRPQALDVRAIDAEIFVHPRHDPGCVNEAHDFMRPFASSHRHALVLFDHDGSGREGTAPNALADEVRQKLEASGWADRAEAIVLAPELEVWVWSDSPQVAACLGWAERQPPLRDWLAATGLWPADQAKPADPKHAMEAALRQARKPRSSAIFLDLASRVSLRGHNEPAFLRLSHALRAWFPPKP